MTKRFLSSFVMLVLLIPLLLIGKTAFNIGVYIVAIMALYEFIKIKEEKKRIPSFIKFISFIMILTNKLLSVTTRQPKPNSLLLKLQMTLVNFL